MVVLVSGARFFEGGGLFVTFFLGDWIVLFGLTCCVWYVVYRRCDFVYRLGVGNASVFVG